MPNDRQALRKEADRILTAAGILTDEDAAPLLGGNWLPFKPPDLLTFVGHCLIVAKEGTTETGLIRFDLWDAQREALEVIERESHLVIPKGRQVGITWLELAAMLHAGVCGGNRLFNIARQNEEYAEGAIRRLLILAGYDPDSEPPNLRVLEESPMPERWRPRIVGKTVRRLTFDNGCQYKALTATRSIARGDAAYWALCDEYAFWPWPEKQLAALQYGAARVHVPSTGQGEEDAFHRLVQTAQRGAGQWRWHFIPATADPRRDAEWLRVNVTEASDPDLARRENALSIDDVFRPASGGFFKRFNRERNVREVDLVENWPVEYGVDFGRAHPFCVWVQLAPSGQPFVIAEYGPEDELTPDFAAGIQRTENELTAEESVELVVPHRVMYCDPAGKTRNSQTSRSEFDVMRAAGFDPRGRTSSVREGCELMMNSIADDALPLVVHPRCTQLIRALTQMPHDPHDANVYHQKHPVFSHPLDALRYWYVNHQVTVRTSSATLPKQRSRTVTSGLRSHVY